MLGVLFYHKKKDFTLDWRILTLLYKEDNKYYCWPRTFSFELEFPLRHFYCRYESARLHSSLFLMEIQVKLKKPTQKSEMQISFLTLRSTPLAKVFPFFYSTFHYWSC